MRSDVLNHRKRSKKNKIFQQKKTVNIALKNLRNGKIIVIEPSK